MSTQEPMVSWDRVEKMVSTIEKRMDPLHAQIAKLVQERDALRYALEEAAEVLQRYEDIKDGPEGQQLPNDAMRALQTIRALGVI